MSSPFIQIHPDDNVAVAIRDVPSGTEDSGQVFEEIPMGHKAALTGITVGEKIVKYGFPIGVATADIPPGAHIHAHNMATGLGSDTELTWTPPASESPEQTGSVPTFMGYRRPDGRAATRNEIWVINTVACVNVASQQIAFRAQREFNPEVCGIDGIHAFTHPYGCSQLGDDLGLTRKALSALVRHPNAAGVLIIGLGCENNTLKSFLEEVGALDSNRVKFFNAQQVGDEIEHGLEMVRELVTYAADFKREPIPASELVLGMKCGGSDGFSGITANPLVGRVAERLTNWGGTAVLTEVPEMFGAEAPLFSRCDSQETFDGAVAMVNNFKDYFRRHDEPIYENPSPGNKDGGITTLEEKSLGCIQKGGRAAVKQIEPYGGTAKPALGGLCLIEAPGNDGVSCTALAAAGVHCILFTTGRGTPLGVPVPTMKIASNSSLAERKPGWIDFNAGVLLESGNDTESTTSALMEKVLAVASGEPARNEINCFREITIWKQGVTL
ncbi:MAG: altronate dehydratase family protein [Akkermansiaceae bacterium]|jgi:altronate hydrolase|nr:altronate dehydratase family protein [Akkermansiaceae bacterium]MDP4779407.1 altronate dehydratase family protein [Akkermansiaceae bacterium]MDP4846747.1 altronate dehydratase family protein [Akkermansiaceae bacterium]MDP4897084.1 altronate dehydratase family protein [Akkermansiaceae bacterium]